MKRISAFVLCVIATVGASQQPPRGGAGFGPGGFPRVGPGSMRLGLVMRPDVQKEIKITAAQMTQLEAITKALQSSMPKPPAQGTKPGSKPPQVDFSAMLKRMEESGKKVSALLTAPQRQRLDEIGLQQLGPMGILQPEVAAKLQLTASQKSAMQKAVTDGFSQRPADSSGKPDFEKMRKEMEARRASISKKIMGVMTPAQRTQYMKMLGKPFKLNMTMGSRVGMAPGMGGRRGGPPPPAGGRGGGN